MARKVIANLATLLTADAVQFMDEFKRADNYARRISANISKTVSKPVGKISLGLLGAGGVAALVTNELRSVISEIERVPGIPATTVASIVQMREDVTGLRDRLRGAAAAAIGFGADFARAVGAGAAMIMGASGDDVSNGLMAGEWSRTPDQIAAGADPQFYDKLTAAQDRLKEATRRADLAMKSQGEQVVALRAEAEKFEGLAALRSQNSVQQTESLTKAAERRAEAERLSKQITDQNSQAMKEMANAIAPLNGAMVNSRETVDALRASLGGLYYKLAQIGEGDDIVSIEKRTAVFKDITGVSNQLTKALEHQARMAAKVGDVFESSFEDAIFSGESLGDVLSNLGMELGKLILRQTVLQPLANWIGGGVSSGIGKIFGFAKGGRPQPGQPALVGEQGPELWLPDSAGKIYPAQDTAAMLGGGGGGGGNVYNIDARGADRAGFAELKSMIRQLDASIEVRSVIASLDAQRRGYAG